PPGRAGCAALPFFPRSQILPASSFCSPAAWSLGSGLRFTHAALELSAPMSWSKFCHAFLSVPGTYDLHVSFDVGVWSKPGFISDQNAGTLSTDEHPQTMH